MHDDKIVNTDNVSNILVDDSKFIFNMNYSVSLNENKDKLIPDYVYFNCNKEDYAKIAKQISSLGWISSEYGCTGKSGFWKPNKRIINPKSISFIKLEEWKLRIIFNLNTSISFYKNDYEKTSDFIFYDYDHIDDYEEDLQKITKLIGEVK